MTPHRDQTSRFITGCRACGDFLSGQDLQHIKFSENSAKIQFP